MWWRGASEKSGEGVVGRSKMGTVVRELPAGGLPPQLPLVPLYEAVVLPLGFLRVRIPDSAVAEVELVQHLAASFLRSKQSLRQRKDRPPPLVAAVPVVSSRVVGAWEPVRGNWTPDDARTSTTTPGRDKTDDTASNGALVQHGVESDEGDQTLFPVGTVAAVLQVQRVQAEDGVEVYWDMVLEGVCRIKVERVERQAGALFYSAAVQQLDGFEDGDTQLAARAPTGPPEELVSQLREVSARLIAGLRSALLAQQGDAEEGERPSRSVMGATERLRSMLDTLPPARAADVLASALADPKERLAVLSAVDAKHRIELIIALANGALKSLQRAGRVSVRSAVQHNGGGGGSGGWQPAGLSAVRKQQSGLDDASPPDDEYRRLERRLQEADLPAEVLEVGMKEIGKLERMGEQHPGAASVRSYVELIAELPWQKKAAQLLREDGTQLHQSPVSLESVKQALDSGHQGLGKVKQRILEYVAVGRLVRRESVPGPILCFIGPPGVGKTSLADAIASVLGRPLARIALGGVRDEAEIRGHRRTYIGAMPGRVIQGLRRAKCRDPVMLLDEVDKVGNGVRGDPMSALLEVLDPAQNHGFTDTYLGLPFDLSGVVFVATANEEGNIPGPLRDRMEIIRISGYTLEERVAIAQQHLLPRVLTAHGLTNEMVAFDGAALQSLAMRYTREAGVRDLSRKLAAVCRHVALQIAMQAEGRAVPLTSPTDSSATAVPTAATDSRDAVVVVVGEELLSAVLGPPRYTGHEAEERISGPGTAAGLVWTPVGGSLQFVEVACTARGEAGREGAMTVTGQAGEVLGESARIALSWLRANAARLGLLTGLEPPAVLAADVHIHFPAGAIPKDGPSAGVTLACALLSLFSGRTVRGDVAMTGELTLRGLVLPVGGVKEKILAARQAGMAAVLLPARNLRDVSADVPPELLGEMQVVGCGRMEEVLEEAFTGGYPISPSAKL